VTLAGLAGRLTRGFRTRAAFGLRPLTAPVIVFIPLGVLLGPRMLGVVPGTALARLDAIVSISLATLGVFIGLALGREGSRARRLFLAASVEASVTILIVAAAVLALLTVWQVPMELSYSLVALALGLCASASAAPAVDTPDDTAGRVAARVADLDDVLPIMLGGGLIVMAGPGSRSVMEGAVLTVALGLAIGLAGWLLIERAEGLAERGVFILGSLALLGGSAAYLGLSPLLTGMAAGWLWVIVPGGCDLLMAGELRKVQHPLVVLLLITTGASLETSLPGIWLFAPYLVFRLAGKLIGGWTASRIAAGVAPGDLGAYLIPPGVIGIAFALNLQQVSYGAAETIVFAVALGALASEVLALFLTPWRRTA
jgi:hypothetical protein